MVSFQRFNPATFLQGFIHSYWMVQANEDCNLDLIPDGYPELAIPFQKGNVLNIGQHYMETFSGASLIGQLTERTRLFLKAGDRIFSVKMYPWTSYLLFGIPCWQLKNALTDLEGLTAEKPFRQMLCDLRSTDHTDQMVQLINQGLLKKIADLQTDNAFVRYAVQQIFQSKGTINIQQLTSCIQVSRRYVEKVFKNRIGLTPKHYAQLIRVKKASLLLLDDDFQGNLNSVATQLNYYDQSHFVKDFKAIALQTPSAYLQQNGNLSFDKLEVYLRQWDYSA